MSTACSTNLVAVSPSNPSSNNFGLRATKLIALSVTPSTCFVNSLSFPFAPCSIIALDKGVARIKSATGFPPLSFIFFFAASARSLATDGPPAADFSSFALIALDMAAVFVAFSAVCFSLPTFRAI